MPASSLALSSWPLLSAGTTVMVSVTVDCGVELAAVAAEEDGPLVVANTVVSPVPVELVASDGVVVGTAPSPEVDKRATVPDDPDGCALAAVAATVDEFGLCVGDTVGIEVVGAVEGPGDGSEVVGARLGELVAPRSVGVVVVGNVVEAGVGAGVGSEVVGAGVGAGVGSEVVGAGVGAVVGAEVVRTGVGSEVVGAEGGAGLGSEVRGAGVGAVVGAEVVGTGVGSEVVGAEVGDRVGSEVAGVGSEGDEVGSEVAGAGLGARGSRAGPVVGATASSGAGDDRMSRLSQFQSPRPSRHVTSNSLNSAAPVAPGSSNPAQAVTLWTPAGSVSRISRQRNPLAVGSNRVIVIGVEPLPTTDAVAPRLYPLQPTAPLHPRTDRGLLQPRIFTEVGFSEAAKVIVFVEVPPGSSRNPAVKPAAPDRTRLCADVDVRLFAHSDALASADRSKGKLTPKVGP